ncbi:MAG TPA: hypothetical protein VFY14_09295 [Streptomyces sp.]|nr:hypothetical protein [Streptomyces sp.]
MNNPRDEFDRMMSAEFTDKPRPESPQYADPAPYGTPVKTGLTPRGKAALAIGGTILATGALLSWQHYSTQQAANEAKTAEIQLQRDQFELEKLKELSKVNAENTKLQTAADKDRQKQVDACVRDNKTLVGKQLGATLGSVIKDCQDQYPATTNTGDMANAASTTNTPTSGGVNSGVLIGAGALALGLAGAAMKNKKPTPA